MSYLLCVVQFTLLVSLVFLQFRSLQQKNPWEIPRRTKERLGVVNREVTIPELKMLRQEDQATLEPHSKNFSHKTNILPFAHTTKKPRKERGKAPDIHMLVAQLQFHHNICVSLLYSDIEGRRRRKSNGKQIFCCLRKLKCIFLSFPLSTAPRYHRDPCRKTPGSTGCVTQIPGPHPNVQHRTGCREDHLQSAHPGRGGAW